MLRVSIPAMILVLTCVHCGGAVTFDALAASQNRTVQYTQLERLIQTSIDWLRIRALYSDYPVLIQYTGELQRVLKASCKDCYDYFEAVAILRSLGRHIHQIIQDDKLDIHYPVLRRSYMAAAWMLQRSKLFAWQSSHLQSNVLSTLFRLYMHHIGRAKGRAVSFHHVSKCGGTTMCQLAASNRCSNPSMDEEQNCVLRSSLDGPLWMVAHDVSEHGASPNMTYGRLDVPAPSDTMANLTWSERAALNQQFAVEPALPMWLMYSCPYAPKGKNYDCQSRNKEALDYRSTFLANERTLSQEHGVSQVCPEFTNAIILREPVPHVVSLLAEVKYRYVRQLAVRHNITSWQPPAWNLTWWETLGPALVGNYATRSLIGRDSFCRSAGNMTRHQLSLAVDSLLGFDLVMTLDRARDIDLLVSTLLGWPARSFSSQPASRVRAVRPKTVMLNWHVPENEGGKDAAGQGRSGGRSEGQQQQKQQQLQQSLGGGLSLWLVMPDSRRRSSSSSSAPVSQAVRSPFRVMLQQLLSGLLRRFSRTPTVGKARSDNVTSTTTTTTTSSSSSSSRENLLDPDEVDYSAGDDTGDAVSDAEFEQMAAAMATFKVPDPPTAAAPPAIAEEVLEAEAAVALVKASWQERQAQLLGVKSVRDLGQLLPRPLVQHIGETDEHGAYLVRVITTVSAEAATSRLLLGNSIKGGSDIIGGEIWHAFPRHNVAFAASDMSKLEQLTRLDQELVRTADLLLDLDSIWLRSLLHSHHHRKRMKSAASTYTACGFAGMMPLSDTVQDQVFQPATLLKSNNWIS